MHIAWASEILTKEDAKMEKFALYQELLSNYRAKIYEIGWSLILKKLGINLIHRNAKWPIRCRCVFHKEKNASLQFRHDTGTYRCFGCGCGGDMFDFVANKLEGRKQAYRFFKNKFGVKPPPKVVSD